MVAKIIRALSGVLLVLQCTVLIVFFGILPLLGFSPCPVLGTVSGSLYKDGSLAFVREVPAAELAKGDVAVYYKGRTAVGAKVAANAQDTSRVTVAAGSGNGYVPYAKITGKGSAFSVPMLGNYADWLLRGSGLLTSVIALGVLFAVFAVSAFCVRDN